MFEINLETRVLEADSSHKDHLLKALLDKSSCPICQDHMYVPFTTRCGHDFCYQCLNKWLNDNDHQTCPTCRCPIHESPYHNVFAKQMLDSILALVEKSLNNEEEPEVFESLQKLKKERDSRVRYYMEDLQTNNLFKKMFDDKRTAIIDSSDGVARCSNCHWEVEGNICSNCHMTLINPYINQEEEAEDSDYDGQLHYGLNAHHYMMRSEDSYSSEQSEDDSFIDDREIEQIEQEVNDGVEDVLSSHSSSSSPVRRTQQYFPTNLEDEAWEDRLSDDSQYEEWAGFQERTPNQNQMVYDVDEESSDSDGPSEVSRVRRVRPTIIMSDDDEEDED